MGRGRELEMIIGHWTEPQQAAGSVPSMRLSDMGSCLCARIPLEQSSFFMSSCRWQLTAGPFAHRSAGTPNGLRQPHSRFSLPQISGPDSAAAWTEAAGNLSHTWTGLPSKSMAARPVFSELKAETEIFLLAMQFSNLPAAWCTGYETSTL